MRRLALAAAIGLTATLLVWRPWQAPIAPSIAWGVCGGAVHDLEIVATGELRLHRALLPDGGPDAALVRDAVALQLRHAFAVPHNDPGWRSTLTPDGPPHTVEVLAAADVAYGKDIALDWPADPELRPESDYVRRALARGRLHADDPALAITWRARVRAAQCDLDPPPLDDLRLPVPHDPYLLYWAIDADQRVEQVYHHKRAVTFPCAEPDIADYAHPEYLWYYWQPGRDGCDELLQSPRDLGEVALSIARRRPPSGDLTAWRRALAASLGDRPLRLVLVFGYLDHQVPRPDPELVRAALERGTSPDPELEWGAEQYLRFVRGLDALLDDRTWTLPVRDDGPAAEIRGALRRSGRRVEIAAHLTEADYLAPAAYPPRHAPLLLAALRDADAILYAGHSGLGLNFSRARLEQAAPPGAVAAALAASPARLLAFIGCNTYAYFGDDFARDLPETLFVYTGDSSAETAAGALHVLHTVDCLLAADDATIRAGACDLPSPAFLIYDYAR